MIIRCTTRVATTLDVNGTISAGQLSFLPNDFEVNKMNQLVDYCVPHSTILNVSVMDGAAIT